MLSCKEICFQSQTLFRDCTRAEAYLGHCQKCRLELFCRKTLGLLVLKASSSVLIAILNMFLFAGMNLLEGIVTGPAYNDQKL